MYTGDELCHSSSIEARVPVDVAFDYLSDGLAQGEWALGSMNRRKLDENLYSGVSLFNGAELFVRIEADREHLLIYYHVGTDRKALQPRNVVRIVPGEVVGRKADVCLVTLLTWRDVSAAEEKWKLTCVSHETEMFIIRDRLEKLSGT